MKLREMLQAARLKQADLARRADVDGSMISYVCRGGRPSYRTACAIAKVLSRHDKRMRMPVYLWMLSLGFAPPPLKNASRERQVECLVNVGVPAE